METSIYNAENNGEKGCPAISVIMCVHNVGGTEELELAIESILSQSFSDFEFIICDDASNEKTWELLLYYQTCDSRISLLQNKDNKGVAASLNRCIGAARGKYIARMDGDDISAVQRLQEQYDFLEEHMEYAFAGCNAELIDCQSNWGIRCMPEKPGNKDFLPYSPYIHPAVMGRRELFLHDGGYCVSKLTWRCEDYEFFMRQFSQQYYGYNIQKVLYYYREDSKAYQKRQYRYCIAEAKIRLQGYKKIRVLWKGGIIFWLKPILVGMIPKKYYSRWKRRNSHLTLQGEIGT